MIERQQIPEYDLHAYVDGELPAMRRTEIELIARVDPDVAARIAELRRINQDLRAMLDPVADEPLPPQWVDRIRNGPRRDFASRRRIFALAASVAVAVVGFVSFRRVFRDDVDQSLIDVAIELRAQPVVRGRRAEELSERANMALAQTVGLSAHAPDLLPMGFALTAVDASVRLRENLAVRLDYRDEDERLFTVIACKSVGEPEFVMLKRDETRICLWQDEAVTTVMMAEVSAGEMLRLASRAYSTIFV